MNSILQLNPPLWLETPHGEALAHIVINHGPEHELLWVCFNTEDGQCWCWQNSRVRATRNVMMGRVNPEKPVRTKLSEYSCASKDIEAGIAELREQAERMRGTG